MMDYTIVNVVKNIIQIIRVYGITTKNLILIKIEMLKMLKKMLKMLKKM
jgi:hypothetical protein